MEVDNGQIIYPQTLKKYSGSIEEVRSRAKDGNNRIVSFCARIKIANFKYFKCHPARQDAESDLIRQNIENDLEIKNIMFDHGDHYSVRLPGNKKFLADKVDLHFIEANIWCANNNNYVVTNQNGRHVQFHNLILGHTPVMDCSVDHINRNPLDNRRINLRLANRQTQNINQNPRNMVDRSGVNFNRNSWCANWVDAMGAKKIVVFSVNRFGYEVARHLANAKRLEMELSLNHYRLALHNLPPLRPDDMDDTDDEPDVPDDKIDELEVNLSDDEIDYESDLTDGELEPNVPDDEIDVLGPNMSDDEPGNKSDKSDDEI